MVKIRFDHDTIAAISTPLGEGGLAVIRVSGDDAVAVVDRVFAPGGKVKPGFLGSVASHTVHYGYIHNRQGERVDEVLVTVMLAPRTFTREDTVEISCHGGIVSAQRVLEAVLGAGARLAEPGEFTKRAFLNGRIDLAQAEAVIDLIRAKTEASQAVALTNLRGGLSERVRRIREAIVEVLTYLEASIDFPEDEIPPLEQDLDQLLTWARSEVAALIETARTGRIYREGLATVILGRPNVGKSSLLNALLGEERAIVTQIPGTTRDILEEQINLRGLPLRIIDTAGIRATTDEVERIGVTRSIEAIERADIILFLVDYSSGLTPEDWEVAATLPVGRTILVANKADLPSGSGFGDLVERFGEPVLISAKEHTGLDELKDRILEKASVIKVDRTETVLVTNLRHLEALRQACESLENAHQAFVGGMPADLITIDLHAAVAYLGEITGDTASADVIDRIFANFCIGK
ncbi:MAG: tRNA uridine-5-carboxymethylaminomethyl(34) synthesis GTPase MnmE [Firmicutes bacterium]|nr:tRNA uridine-5-carboxymethylaminomethyl(34) synthesis GTPase MnmE [Bacillota bacterium]